MRADLVVVNYKTPSDLDAFVRSVHDHPSEAVSSLTIVDVDAAASDSCTIERGIPIRRLGLPTNVGYARACNAAAKGGDAEIIAFFNADVRLTPGSVDACCATLMADPDRAVVGPRQVDSARRIRHAGIFGTQARPRLRGWNEVDCGQYVGTEEAVSVSGSAYFVKREVFESLTRCPVFKAVAPESEGAFLPTPHYYEETWLSYHAAAHGSRIIYYGASTLIHEWHRASPVGGWAERQMPLSRKFFRAACDAHGIPHD